VGYKSNIYAVLVFFLSLYTTTAGATKNKELVHDVSRKQRQKE